MTKPSKQCANCGKVAEPNMVKHAKKHKQDILCENCDKDLSSSGAVIINSRKTKWLGFQKTKMNCHYCGELREVGVMSYLCKDCMDIPVFQDDKQIELVSVIPLAALEKFCIEKAKSEMTCSICNRVDNTFTAYCAEHHRVPHHYNKFIMFDDLLTWAKQFGGKGK